MNYCYHLASFIWRPFVNVHAYLISSQINEHIYEIIG